MPGLASGAYVDQDLGKALQEVVCPTENPIQRDLFARAVTWSSPLDEYDRTCKRCTPTVDAQPLSLQSISFPRSRAPQEPCRRVLSLGISKQENATGKRATEVEIGSAISIRARTHPVRGRRCRLLRLPRPSKENDQRTTVFNNRCQRLLKPTVFCLARSGSHSQGKRAGFRAGNVQYHLFQTRIHKVRKSFHPPQQGTSLRARSIQLELLIRTLFHRPTKSQL